MKPEVKNDKTKSTKPIEQKLGRNYTSKESEKESEKEYESDKDVASNEGMSSRPDYKHHSNDSNIVEKEKGQLHSDGHKEKDKDSFKEKGI